MTTLQGNVNDIRSNVIELSVENVEIRSDIEKKARESESKMNEIKKAVMEKIDTVSYRVEHVESFIANSSKILKNSSKDSENKSGISKVTGIQVSGLSEATSNMRTSVPVTMLGSTNSSHSTIERSECSTGDVISNAFAQQTKFNVAMDLGRCPSMYFSGELYDYVQFVTMFRGSFDKTINDSVALYEILIRHTTGSAKSAIEPCVYSTPGEGRYEAAMEILKTRYGPKSGVIRAHRERLLSGKKLSDTVADFEKLSNELKRYCAVLNYYDVDTQYLANDVVRDIVHRRMSTYSGREFSKFIQRKG